MARRQVFALTAVLLLVLPPAARALSFWEPVFNFARNSDTLSDSDLERATNWATSHAADMPARVVLTGHTDSVGDAAYNEDLSLRRAQKVRDILVANGIRPEVIVVYGRGESQLAVATGDEVDEPLNRRVTLEVFY